MTLSSSALGPGGAGTEEASGVDATSAASATLAGSAAKERAGSTVTGFSCGDGSGEVTSVDPASLDGRVIDREERGAGLGPIAIAASSSVPKASAGELTVSA